MITDGQPDSFFYFLFRKVNSVNRMMMKQAKAHSAIDNPANLHKTIEQSPVPLNIIGKASANGKVSTTKPRSAPQSNISGGLCSSHTCRKATPDPSPAKRIMSQEDIRERNLFVRKGREIKAVTPMRINAYRCKIHIGQGASPS